MSVHDYIIDHHGLDWSKLLLNWAWLLRARPTVWIVNRFGDLFLVLDDGTIHMLDVACGSLKEVAKSRDDFAVKIDEDDNAIEWLMIPLVDRLVASGILLRPGECYGLRRPPVLGGTYSVDNIAVLPINDYYAAYGVIHRQISDLPDGSQVVIKIQNKLP
jgi:hypothetical protein